MREEMCKQKVLFVVPVFLAGRVRWYGSDGTRLVARQFVEGPEKPFQKHGDRLV